MTAGVARQSYVVTCSVVQFCAVLGSVRKCCAAMCSVVYYCAVLCRGRAEGCHITAREECSAAAWGVALQCSDVRCSEGVCSAVQ